MKAMILAAGRGERMQPLTHSTPKPLLQVDGQYLIAYHLHALAQAGIQDIVINVCYHADQIMRLLGDGKRYGVRITYTDETQECLGTGGGIQNALPLLGEQPFILLSADIFTHYDLHQLPKQLKGLAHLVLVNNPNFHPQGDFYLDQTGYLQLQADHGMTLTYANIAIIDPQLFQYAPSINHFPLSSVLKLAIIDQAVTGEHYQGFWDNVGTPQQLHALNQQRIHALVYHEK